MKKKIIKRKKRKARAVSAQTSFLPNSDLVRVKKHIEKLLEQTEKSEERIQDIEIHLNLLTRLLTTLCVEKFGMRIGVLKRLIKRIEKEAIRDSQIMHLETLYKMPPANEKKNPPPAKSDPWEEIS